MHQNVDPETFPRQRLETVSQLAGRWYDDARQFICRRWGVDRRCMSARGNAVCEVKRIRGPQPVQLLLQAASCFVSSFFHDDLSVDVRAYGRTDRQNGSRRVAKT